MPIDLRSFIVGACCVVLAFYIAGKCQDYWNASIRKHNRKEIDQRIAALDARLIDYDKVAAQAIADLETDWWAKLGDKHDH